MSEAHMEYTDLLGARLELGSGLGLRLGLGRLGLGLGPGTDLLGAR